MPIFFRVQPSLPDPVYRQIVDAIQGAIKRDELRPGERLPSIRALAQQLAVNPNTVARAYRELEHLGQITSFQGSGYEVTGGPMADEAAKRRLTEAVGAAVAALGPQETLNVVREAVKRIQEVHHGGNG